MSWVNPVFTIDTENSIGFIEQFFYVEFYNVLLFCEVKIKMHVTYNEWILPVQSKIQQTKISVTKI